MKVEDLRELINEMSEADIQYIKLTSENDKIEITLPEKVIQEIVAPSTIGSTIASKSKTDTKEAIADSKYYDISSKYIGFFGRNNPKDKKAYVNLRDVIKKGQIIAAVESIELCNEVASDVNGKIVEILVEDGQPVEYGQPLFRVQKL